MEEILDEENLSYEDIASPGEIYSTLPASEQIKENVRKSRKVIKSILEGSDNRKLVFAGPCSIHDPIAGLEYAKKLKILSEQVKDVIYIVMRTYLEKPRSTIGWKGLLYDPELNNSNNLTNGISIGRKFLLDINSLGVPCATEFVRTDLPKYISDLVCWAAIGARTVESQTHRELASGLGMPIGFKNSTSGDIKVAVDACLAACHPHTFLDLNLEGKICKIKTPGNKYGHIVLRGGNGGPNYHPERVEEAVKYFLEYGLKPNVIVDCSHANCNKVYEKQEEVAYTVLKQINENSNNIVGIMLESNLFEGKQNFPKNTEEISKLKYGVSITDPCVSFETTERIIRKYASDLRKNNQS